MRQSLQSGQGLASENVKEELEGKKGGSEMGNTYGHSNPKTLRKKGGWTGLWGKKKGAKLSVVSTEKKKKKKTSNPVRGGGRG